MFGREVSALLDLVMGRPPNSDASLPFEEFVENRLLIARNAHVNG